MIKNGIIYILSVSTNEAYADWYLQQRKSNRFIDENFGFDRKIKQHYEGIHHIYVKSGDRPKKSRF